MAGRRRGRPPTTMDIIPAPPDESVRINSFWSEETDGELSEFEESVSSVYSDDFEDSTSDEFVEEEVDDEIEENSEERRRMLLNNNDNPSIRDGTENIGLDPRYSIVADYEEEDEEEKQGGEEEEQEVMLHHYRDQDLGNGIVLKVPTGATDVTCHVEPVCAEERTEMLDELVLTDGHMMVSDLYRVVGNGFPPVDNTRYKIQLPLPLPSTKLDKRDLLQFMAFQRLKTWTSHESGYEDGLVSFQVENLRYFVVYAEQRAEVINITPTGYTFVSSKDQRIRVEVPEGSVDTEITISFKIQPTSMNRLEWYRAYDPEVFEGIYALSDILSVRYAVDRALNKPTIVELPIDGTASDGGEVKWLNVENGVYSVSAGEQSVKNGSVRTSHRTNGKSSCQATLVRPGVSDERLIRCAMLQRNELNKCKILTFLSRAAGFQCKCLTVEVVESPNASPRVRSRRKQGFHEIKQSRSPDIDVLRDERIRISFSGNIQQVDKREMKNLIFQFSATSKENCVETKIKRMGFMTGVPYGIVTIKIGSDKHHEVHFYVDYPLDNTINLNKQTQSQESDDINSNVQNIKGLDVRLDSRYTTLQIHPAGDTPEGDGHRCHITDGHDAVVTTLHVTAASSLHTAAPVTNPCHSGVSAEEGDSLQSVSLTPSFSDVTRGRETGDSESLSFLSGSTSGIFSEEVTPLSNNRKVSVGTSIGRCNKTHGYVPTSCERGRVFSDSGVCTEEVTMSLVANNREDANSRTGPIASSSGVRAPWKQKVYGKVQEQGTPTSALPDIPITSPSVKEHPWMQRITPGPQTQHRRGNTSKQPLIAHHLGNNVPREAHNRILQRSTQNKDFSNHKKETTLVDSLQSRDTKLNPGIQRGHKKPSARLPPLSIKEPRGPSKLSSSETHAKQLLTESSLLALSHALATPEWQQVMVDLGMGADNITVIVERAVRENWDPRFKLLLAWYQKHSGKPNLMSNMEESLRRIDRSDIAETIRRVRQERRPFTKDDFTPY